MRMPVKNGVRAARGQPAECTAGRFTALGVGYACLPGVVYRYSMPRMPRLRALALTIALPAVLAAQARPTAIGAADRARIDAAFKDYDKPHAPGCALGVMRNGVLAYARGYGWADL